MSLWDNLWRVHIANGTDNLDTCHITKVELLRIILKSASLCMACGASADLQNA